VVSEVCLCKSLTAAWMTRITRISKNGSQKRKANYGNRVLNALLVLEDNMSTCFSTTIVSCQMT